MKDSTRKSLYIGIFTVLAIIAAALYTIELLAPEPVFDIKSFSLNYVISLPFILLCIIINCGIAAIMNSRALRKRSMAIRMAAEGISAILVAAVLVIVCNLPFIRDMPGYIMSIPFLKSTGAATLINIFILAALEFLIQTDTNRRLQKENAVLQYRQLKSQINPHFLFNSLNALVSLINKDRDLAVKYTRELSAVYRYVLTRDQQDTVTVSEEMEFIRNYIGILKTRFNDGLQFRFDIRPSDLDRTVPPMSLQLLIENAVKHNAISEERPLEIDVTSDGHCLCVSNNVSPRMSDSEKTGTGLENLSKKYAILAGRDISIYSDKNMFSVKLPLL